MNDELTDESKPSNYRLRMEDVTAGMTEEQKARFERLLIAAEETSEFYSLSGVSRSCGPRRHMNDDLTDESKPSNYRLRMETATAGMTEEQKARFERLLIAAEETSEFYSLSGVSCSCGPRRHMNDDLTDKTEPSNYRLRIEDATAGMTEEQKARFERLLIAAEEPPEFFSPDSVRSNRLRRRSGRSRNRQNTLE